MLKPAPRPQTICPQCGEVGIHSTHEACLEALRKVVAKLRKVLSGRA